MPPTSSGRWVSRAAATGGGRTYRGQVPVNWYAALVVIVILGLVSVVYSRYEYQHPHHSTTVQPAVGTTLFAGYSIELCGTVVPPLAPSTNAATAGVSTPGAGVLNVSPHTAAQAGNNATLGLFFSEYPGASLSATKITVPGHGTYRNGQRCGAKTPDAGKRGYVTAMTWPNAVTTKGTPLRGNPADYKIGARTLITVGFAPKGTTLKRPPQATINQMLDANGTVVNGTTTTTTTPISSSTTVPSSTTTTSGKTRTTG
jgi:hypothetical protein